MKRNYFYLVAGLQDIAIDASKLTLDTVALKEELEAELHPKDFQWVYILNLPYDNNNLINIIEKNDKVFDTRGNFSQSFLETHIKNPGDELPAYMVTFLEAHHANEPVFPGMSNENQLAALFYDYMEEIDNAFLKQWFAFYQNLNNLTTALLSRKHDVPYENQIIGSGAFADAIRKSHARDFGLSAEVEYMEDLLNILKIDDVQEREKAIDKIKWHFLDESTFFHYFTVEKVLAFAIKLRIVERWLSIDKEHGEVLFKELINDLKSSYELPEIFTDK